MIAPATESKCCDRSSANPSDQLSTLQRGDLDGRPLRLINRRTLLDAKEQTQRLAKAIADGSGQGVISIPSKKAVVSMPANVVATIRNLAVIAWST
jgi:hypothetical protein